MPTPFETVDAFLAESDFDTQLWCDGCGWETAREMLIKLGEADWERLEREFAGRGSLQAGGGFGGAVWGTHWSPKCILRRAGSCAG